MAKGIRSFRVKFVGLEPVEGKPTKRRLVYEVEDGRGPNYQRSVILTGKFETISVQKMIDSFPIEDLARPNTPFKELEEAVQKGETYEIERESV